MGREVKRVPLHFDWPLNKVWGGYLMPDALGGDDCPDCQNGYSPAGDWLQKVAYIVAGLADDANEAARGRAMHPYLIPLHDISYGGTPARPGLEFGQFADGIAPEVSGDRMFGRDVYSMTSALREAAGLPESWGICPTCDGHASVEVYPGQRAEAEAWEPTEPPEGEGWQMWETTSEGSPQTPVFSTPEGLANYCAAHVSVFGSNMADAAQWLKIITGADFAHVEIAPGVIAM